MLIVYWPITKQAQDTKANLKSTNYRCCLRFSYLPPFWLISRKTINIYGVHGFFEFTVTDILCNALFLQLQHRVGIPVFF